jgi:ribosomal protein S14
MITRACDRCGQPIDEGALRYEARIQVFAAYDPLDISFDDISRDHTEEIRRIVEQCKDVTQEELMKDVYLEFQFDLCRPCQRAYIRDPLPGMP